MSQDQNVLFPRPIDREEALLAPYAMRSAQSRGREHAEPEHPYRGAFQRDRDRVLHSAAFRRLSGKTQVFTGSMGDYHRTRLTHTMEVASIARTIGRCLRLNEDLIEALALLHDIGHPPFGHAGEDVLNECLSQEGGFSHNQFALVLARDLERPYPHYPGLNLTWEVLESQQMRCDKASGDPVLLEAQVVDAADSITYDAHDVDDAVKLGLLSVDELLEIRLVAECHARVTHRFGPLTGKLLRRTLVHELIDYQVSEMLTDSRQQLEAAQYASAEQARRAGRVLRPSAALATSKRELEDFLFQSVYRHPMIIAGRAHAQQQLRKLFCHYRDHPEQLPEKFRQRIDDVGLSRAAADFVAGMTDHYCLQQCHLLADDSEVTHPLLTSDRE